MALHYIIDGYNLIRSVDWLAAGPLRDQRDRIVRFLTEKRPQGSAHNRVTVVFDGRDDVTSPAYAGSVEVAFSRGGGDDADGEIKRRVDALANPRVAVVVTDDRAVQKWVRGAGARVMACAAFLAAARVPRPDAPATGLDAEDAGKIDEELKKFWKLG